MLIVGLLPPISLDSKAKTTGLEGKTISILGDSISTYQNYSNGTAAGTTNSTITNGAVYYPRSGFDVTADSTWWYQAAQELGMDVLVNNSWSSSCLLNTRSGTVGAYVDRCVQLHDDTGDNAGEELDIIAIFLGTNDYYTYPSTLGSYESIAFDTLITQTETGYTYAEPSTSMEAYAIILHKIAQRYPEAQVYCFTLLPRVNSTSQPTAVNEDIKQLANHFGAITVDLHNCGIQPDSTHMGDNLHPNSAGMDAMTNAFVSAVLKNSGEMTYHVSFNLDGVVAMEGTTRTVISGDEFRATLKGKTGNRRLNVSVKMGGADITAQCYADGVVQIPAVNGDVVITASLADRDPLNFRWEIENNAMVSVTTDGNTVNDLTLTSGSITGGALKNIRYSLSKAVNLYHDVPWVIEWRSSGNWDGMLLASNADTSVNGTTYLFRFASMNFLALGDHTNTWNNYGLIHEIDMSVPHLFRLENRIGADGTNTVYLLVDGVEIDAMHHYYNSGTNQNQIVNWANGRDIVFGNIGTSSHPVNNMQLEYLQIWENGHDHDYRSAVTTPTCTEEGYTTYTCDCGSSYVGDYVDAAGHSYENGSCKVCGAVASNPFAGKTIACIGDSITAAYGVTKDKTDYVKLLADRLEMNYIRLGASGTTLCANGGRICNIDKLTESKLQGADVVTIAMGINDFCGAGAGYYKLGDINSTDSSTIYGAVRMWCEQIVELRETDSLKDTQFYFVTPLITSWNNSVTSARNWDQSKVNIHGYTLRDLCNAIIEVAALYDVAVIDMNLISGLYYVSAEDNNIDVFGGDGVHPGDEGHAMMAAALEDALLEHYLLDDHDHSYGSWITTTYPDCEGGEEKRVCGICRATESRELSGKGHSYESGICTVCGAEHPELADYAGKVISIMGDSISTFAGYIPVADGFNREHLARYPQDNLLTDVNETWWMQVVAELDAKLFGSMRKWLKED